MKKIVLAVMLVMAAVQGLALGGEVRRFDLADDAWQLNGHEGQRLAAAPGVEGAVLEVTGDGTYSNAWFLRDVPLEPGTTALLRFKVRRVAGAGGGMTGFEFANFDIPVTGDWTEMSLVFPVTEDRTSGNVRLGQWMQTATLQFAEAELVTVTPAYGKGGLSREETWAPDEKLYQFKAAIGTDFCSQSRCIETLRVGFNSSRWCFGRGAELIYRLDVPELAGGRFFDPTLDFGLCYHTRGTLQAFYSVDRENWTLVAELDTLGSVQDRRFPDFPENGAGTVWVRFFMPDGGSLQLSSVDFRARTAAQVPDTAATDAPLVVHRGVTRFWELVSGDLGFTPPCDADLPRTECGHQTVEKTLRWQGADGAPRSAVVRCRYYVPDFYRENFGARLEAGTDACPLWWCDATQKVTRTRGLPSGDPTPITISAAGNDFESFQLVFRPKSEAPQVLQAASVSEFRDADGNVVPAENVEIRLPYYHYVHRTTDATGVCDFYPDALPPLSVPQQLPADRNTPLWVTVYVPAGTPAGDYAATLSVRVAAGSADGADADAAAQTVEVPVALRVWGFDIPQSNHVETAFGYSPGTCWNYHGVKSPEDRRRVHEMYLQLLSDYRISPYRPTPMDMYTVRFEVDRERPEQSRAVIDWSRFDAEFARVVEKYHFTGFQLSLPGMGGGTFHERWAPSLEGFEEGTPEYDAMFASLTRQIEDHFREKGWLHMTYLYWFDEPDAKDYEFVQAGMNRVKKYAPGIPTMLTEEPSDRVLDGDKLGKIDIWCPVTPNFDPELADLCRARGERFWWYVCCWPHAPYCTEFIDHNAVELRTWLWQTWKYDVRGILVWATNYWTSSTAFPDSAQNPYQDPMSYVSGYSTPPGTKRYWGNGDGRFYYPPLSCAVPSAEPNFDAPVPSIRLALLREGIEDYEMLHLLRQLLDGPEGQALEPGQRAEFRALLEVPEDITRSMTDFSTDPAPIYLHRQKLAAAIEVLLRRVGVLTHP